MKIDWGETNKLWKNNPQAKLDKKMVYFTNLHSDNSYAKFFFEKHYLCSSNIKMYSFIPTYANKKSLSKAIKEGLIKPFKFSKF